MILADLGLREVFSMFFGLALHEYICIEWINLLTPGKD